MRTPDISNPTEAAHPKRIASFKAAWLGVFQNRGSFYTAPPYPNYNPMNFFTSFGDTNLRRKSNYAIFFCKVCKLFFTFASWQRKMQR